MSVSSNLVAKRTSWFSKRYVLEDSTGRKVSEFEEASLSSSQIVKLDGTEYELEEGPDSLKICRSGCCLAQVDFKSETFKRAGKLEWENRILSIVPVKCQGLASLFSSSSHFNFNILDSDKVVGAIRMPNIGKIWSGKEQFTRQLTLGEEYPLYVAALLVFSFGIALDA